MKRKSRSHKIDADLLVALPYPSGKLHPGNVAGTFLPADVLRRYGRLLNKKFIVSSGLDSHGTGVYLQLGPAPYSELQKKKTAYHRFLLVYDAVPARFDSTSRRDHRKFVRRYFASIADRIRVVKASALFCDQCHIECADRLLWDKCNNESIEKLKERNLTPSDALVCRLCGKPPTQRRKSFLVLSYDPQVTRAAARNFAGLQSVEETEKILSRYLPWGVSTNREKGEVYYVWPQALLAYARYGRGRKKVRFFFGKDNLYHHALLLRQMSRGLVYATKRNTYVREYLLDAKGTKISSSLGAHESHPLSTDRLALILSDPRTQDTVYSEDRRKEAVKILNHRVINTFRRIRGILKKKRLIPAITYDEKAAKAEAEYARSMRSNELRKSLLALLAYNDAIVCVLEAEVKNPRMSGTSPLLYLYKMLKRMVIPLYPRIKQS